MRHSILVVSLFLHVGAVRAAGPVHPAISAYEQKMAKEDYSGAQIGLNRALREQLSPEQKLPLWIAKAEFFQNNVADVDRAIRIYRDALKEIPEIDSPTREEIDARLAAAKRTNAEYWRDNVYVSDCMRHVDSDERVAMIDEIRQRLESAGEGNPFRGPLAHCLGIAYSDAEQHHDAYNAFALALDATPALDFAYPTTSFRERALSRWKKHMLRVVAVATMSVLLGLIVLGFFATEPHRWLRWRHLLALPVLVVAWLLVHRGLILLSMACADMSLPEGEGTIAVNSHPEAPLSEALTSHLLLYGLAAILPMYLASLAISRVRLPVTRYVVGASVAFCLMGSVMLAFGLKQDRASVVPNDKARFKYLLGTYRYQSADLLPYVLTDPLAFPGQALDNVMEDRVRRYLEAIQNEDSGDG